jgi:hypothetical protein
MKYIASFSWLRNWNSYDNELQRLIILLVIGIICLLILFFVIIPLIKFIYKFIFNSDYNKEIKSNWRELFSSLSLLTIRNYISGSLPKSERNIFIKRWIAYYIILFFITNLISISLSPIVFFAVLGMLIIGLISSWTKDSKTNFFKNSKKNSNIPPDHTEERLLKIKDLLNRGIINEEEYENQRKKILNEL